MKFVRIMLHMKRMISKLVKTIELIMFKEIIVLFYCDTKSCVKNFGDALNKNFVGYLSGKNVISFRMLFSSFNEPVYVVIGSVLNDLDIKDASIWGAGFISENGKLNTDSVNIHAVRGPLTRDLLISQGYDCPEIYGDPALLVSKFYQPNVTKEYKLGVIPHFIDKTNNFVKELIEEENEDILVIDIEDDIQRVIDNINRCEKIASSSLHGLIVADAYKIPSLWIELSNNVIGNGFKFRDYMLSVNRSELEPYIVNKKIDLSLTNAFSSYEIEFDYNILLESCPFLKSDFNRNEPLFSNDI